MVSVSYIRKILQISTSFEHISFFFVVLKLLEIIVINISKKFNYNFIINDYLFFYLLEQIFIYENIINSNEYKNITSKKYLIKAKFIKKNLIHLIKILIK